MMVLVVGLDNGVDAPGYKQPSLNVQYDCRDTGFSADIRQYVRICHVEKVTLPLQCTPRTADALSSDSRSPSKRKTSRSEIQVKGLSKLALVMSQFCWCSLVASRCRWCGASAQGKRVSPGLNDRAIDSKKSLQGSS